MYTPNVFSANPMLKIKKIKLTHIFCVPTHVGSCPCKITNICKYFNMLVVSSINSVYLIKQYP